MENDFNVLREYIVKQAKSLIEEFNEFYPFGAAIKANSELTPVSTYFEEEYPSSIDVIKHLEKALKKSFQEERFISVAICSDVMVKDNLSDEKIEALEIRFQNRSQNYNVYIPYRKSENIVEFLDEYKDVGTLDLTI
jgi:uncharacterized protein YqgV (UPF0045/DUF77 family)